MFETMGNPEVRLGEGAKMRHGLETGLLELTLPCGVVLTPRGEYAEGCLQYRCNSPGAINFQR